MLLTYTPRDGERRQWRWRPEDIGSREAEAVEELPGVPWRDWDEFGQQFLASRTKARRAALWMFLRREQPDLRFDDVEFRMDELRIGYDDDEVRNIRERITADDQLSEEARAGMLALYPLPGDDTDGEQPAEDADDPKDTAPAAAAGSG